LEKSFALIAIGSTILAPLPARAQDANGNGAPIIDSITIISRDVFDPSEAQKNILFRLSNTLHIRTRRYVVDRELLFDVGDPYDSATVAETLRNLRAIRLFRDVDIDTARVGDRLNVRVDAADAWTTTLQIDLKSSGGDTEWSIGIRERNLLGTATVVRAKHRNEIDRNTLTLEGAQPRLFSTQIYVHGRYDVLTDGDRAEWTVGAPFRSFGDRRGIEFSGNLAQRRVLQFRDGEQFREFWQHRFHQRFSMAHAIRANVAGYLRLGVTGQVKREEYLTLAGHNSGLRVPDSVTATVGAFVEASQARFKVTSHYIGFARDQDVDLSTRVVLAAWFAPSAFGYRQTGVGPSAALKTGIGFGKNFAVVEVLANGLFTSNGLDSGQVRGTLTAVSQVVPKNATVLRVEASTRRGTPPGEEVDLGLGKGPRAFGSHAFTGTRSVWGSLEQRAYLLDDVFGLLGVGFAAFVDYGGAWFPDQSPRLGGDVGFGLRLGSIRGERGAGSGTRRCNARPRWH
jgi:hypothetical protein